MSHTTARVIEQPSHLAKSFIWNLQSRYYEELGIEAWLSGEIASRVTCNSYIAACYARLIAAYVADVGAENVTILELGAGHGRFGFLCANHLKDMAERGSFAAKNWKYVLTDVAERNIGFWEEHEAFRPLVAQGLVDFARYESGANESITTRVSGETIGRDRPAEHLIVIANYFFDSMPMDVWQVEEGSLRLCSPVLSLRDGATVSDPADVQILDQLELSWNPVAKERADYPSSDCNEVVEGLRQSIGSGTFTVPTAGFDIMQELDSWSENGSLLLVADKGYCRESDFVGRPFPTMVQHGCFSFSLNFCAMARWFERRGGMAFLPQYHHDLIATAAFVSRKQASRFATLGLAYHEDAGTFSPDDYHQITRRSDETRPDFKACLALMRLSRCEPMVLYRLRRAIRSHIEDASRKDLQDLRELLTLSMRNYYHLDKTDIPFAVGLIYQRMGDYESAIANYRESLRLFGESPLTLVNIAHCFMNASREDEARQCIERALELAPNDEDALSFKARLELVP